MSARKVRAQRANAVADSIGFVNVALAADSYPKQSVTPVLVIPEAAVRGCRHDDRDCIGMVGAELCTECGSHRVEHPPGCWSEWRFPAILRVAKERKR